MGLTDGNALQIRYRLRNDRTCTATNRSSISSGSGSQPCLSRLRRMCPGTPVSYAVRDLAAQVERAVAEQLGFQARLGRDHFVLRLFLSGQLLDEAPDQRRVADARRVDSDNGKQAGHVQIMSKAIAIPLFVNLRLPVRSKGGVAHLLSVGQCQPRFHQSGRREVLIPVKVRRVATGQIGAACFQEVT